MSKRNVLIVVLALAHADGGLCGGNRLTGYPTPPYTLTPFGA